MPKATGQRKSRADAKLDNRVVADLPFFAGQNRTKKHKAAIHLAEGFLTTSAVARELNISRSTLNEWRNDPDFQAVQAEYEEQIRADCLSLSIANKFDRLQTLDMLYRKGKQIISARQERYGREVAEAESAENATRRFFGDDTPPEAATGLMVKNVTMSATGQKVINWAYDSALAKDLKDTEKQAAQELGQWDEKSTVDMQQSITAIRIIGED